jgi:hypothetical protein
VRFLFMLFLQTPGLWTRDDNPGTTTQPAKAGPHARRDNSDTQRNFSRAYVNKAIAS